MEDFKKQLMGVTCGDIPKGLMYGYELNSEMITMIGYKRLTNLEVLIKDVVANNIEGHVIETGVWKGGACIFMRKLLNDLGSAKKVYVADSFEGLPKPDIKYPHDSGDTHHMVGGLAISIDDVRANFKKYRLLKKTIFIKGWFKDTLPRLKKKKFSIIRLDGDMYESTMDALVNLYPLLQTGGFCIIDDYGVVPGCHHAVNDYRRQKNITDEIMPIDGYGVYWKKSTIDVRESYWTKFKKIIKWQKKY
jgi:hypothetical protein